MPKAWSVKSLQPEMPLSVAAALVLEVKLPEVLSYEAAARSGDVDGIHDMRVAAKRLREALRVLLPGLPPAARKGLLRDVEALNDHLGQVRDRDVMGQFFALVGGDSRGHLLQPLIAHLQAEREKHFHKLLRFLDRLHDRGFAPFYAEVMAEMRERPDAGQPSIHEFAAGAIGERLDAVEANWAACQTPYDVDPFHRQRIRVKKLKYALEPFLVLLPRDIKQPYGLIAELQEVMGLIHDCDVQAEVLGEWLQSHRPGPGLSVAQDSVAYERRRHCAALWLLLRQMAAADWGAAVRACLPRVPA